MWLYSTQVRDCHFGQKHFQRKFYFSPLGLATFPCFFLMSPAMGDLIVFQSFEVKRNKDIVKHWTLQSVGDLLDIVTMDVIKIIGLK